MTDSPTQMLEEEHLLAQRGCPVETLAREHVMRRALVKGLAVCLGLILFVAACRPKIQPAVVISSVNARGVTELARWGADSSGEEVAWSPDGRQLAVASKIGVYLYALETLQQHGLIRTNAYVRSIAFSSDGHTLASSTMISTRVPLGTSMIHTVNLWDASSGQLLRTLEGHAGLVESMKFSPDGHILATGSDDKTVKLWDVSNGQLLQTLKGHTGVVSSISFSPDGRTLASGSWDKTAKLWDVSSGQLLRNLDGHTFSVYSVAYSPDGRRLASSGSITGAIQLWEVSSGQLLRTLAGHSQPVESLSFSPDGGMLASAGWDTTARLWDVSSGQLLRTLSGHTKFVTSVVFSPDGRLLASGSAGDGTIRLWGLP